MWEFSVFKRLIPALVVIVIGVVIYLGVKYTVDGLYTYGYCATTDDPSLNPATWTLANWIFPLFGIWAFFCCLVWAWTIITGRQTLGGEGGGRRGTPRRKPVMMEQPRVASIFPFIKRPPE